MSELIHSQPELLIRAFTMVSLGGLLMAIGLRLEVSAVASAIRQSRLEVILPLNFMVVPAAVSILVRAFELPLELAIGMLLLAAAPFAPVVPVFVKMARGDLALAAGLTALFPVFSTFLTPLVCEASLTGLADGDKLQFHPWDILVVLSGTVTLPLLMGMALRRALPRLASQALRPLETMAEITGAVSLAFVTYVEFGAIVATGWKPLLVMTLAGELSFLLGLALGGSRLGGRQVIAFGTSNRNIALALLIAVDSFAGTPVLGAVVANGLLLIFLGLIHVGFYRLSAGFKFANA